MITFKQFVSESINDKGILKAIFVIGLPGAGKSYTVSKLQGTVSPRIVNTDKASEFLSIKWKKPISSENWNDYKDTATRITKSLLTGYIDGMLPLFVDGTSNDVSNILHRIGILESIGYDVGVVFVNTSLEVAKQRATDRAAKINRHVDMDFIEQVHLKNKENAAYLKSKVSYFKEVDNNGDNVITDKELYAAFKTTQSFFNAPVVNPVGRRTLDKMKEQKQKYLSPNILSKDVLSNKIDGWYKT